MIINSSDITLAAAHSKVQVHEKSESLLALASKPETQETVRQSADKVSISEKALKHLEKDLEKALKHLEKNIDKGIDHPEKGYKKALKHLAKDMNKAIKHLEKHIDKAEKHETGEINKIEIDSHNSSRLGLVKNLVEAFTGKEIKIKDLRNWMDKIQDHDDNDDDHDGNDKHKKTHKHDHHRNQRAWGINYTMSETHYERQDLTFNAGGVVRTADGREINFSLDLMMSREYMSQQDVSFTAAGIGSTPVIVDFQGPASELTNAEFNFGVEGEGESETVSYLSLGNGLLSLDMNNDSTITSTNELFGPATGNGFAELAAYDHDGNNWIDENDTVFSQLQLWSRDAEGNAVLNGLLDQNVGAIYLGNVDTPFDLKDSQNTLLGQVEKSGVYLSEDGTPGTIQQLSLIV